MGLFGKKTTKEETKKKEEKKTPAKKTESKADVKKSEKKPESKKKAEAPKKEVKVADIKTPASKTTTTGKTVYHVTKRDNEGREWKVFIQTSNKVIKLFPTQAEALAYAKSLCKNKDDGSYVMLHGLDGKIRKY